MLTLTVPAGLKRKGREMRMLVENADDQTAAGPSLLRIIARAHHIQARLIQKPKLSVHDIAFHHLHPRPSPRIFAQNFFARPFLYIQ
jgi:hypothetical protein